MREVTSEDVITSLKGVSYPTTKKEMVEQAKKNNASDDVICNRKSSKGKIQNNSRYCHSF